jgi:hypothetical protein
MLCPKSTGSFREAENQAAQLTNIYTGFSKAASARITEDFSKALSDVAVKTGGTVSDIQKSLATAPFLSRDLSFGQRGAILGDIQRIQTFASQAGLGNNAADIFKKIATGQTNAMELEGSDDALSKVIGAQLRSISGGTDLGSISIKDRTRILQDVIKNLDVNELEELAKESGGFRVVLAKFSASLFNPKAGLFGAMREFTLKTGEAPTTLFKETTKLFESIFGESGFIKTLGRELAKAFGVRGEDAAVKFLGRGIRFITNLIKNVTDLIDDVLNNPLVKGIVEITRRAFDGIVGFFRQLDDIAKNPPDLSVVSVGNITDGIKQIGEGIRGFLKKIGDTIRGTDISETSESGTSILNTIIDEAGKNLITFFREVGGALLGKVGTITADLATKLPGTILGLFTRLFSEGGPIGIIIGSVIAAKVGRAAFGGAQALGGGIRGLRNIFNRQEGGPLGALNRSLNRPFSPLNQVRAGNDLEGGRGGFQSQVLSRMDAIIRILGGYQGPSSPLELGDTDPRRGPRPPEGSDIDRPRKGERVGRDGRTSRQRAQDLRRQRGGFRGRIGRFGSRIGDFIGDVGYVAREAGSGFLEDARNLIIGDDYLDDFDRNIDRPIRKGERIGRDGRTSMERARSISRRRRIGGLTKGLKGFGKGALIAGGITAGISFLGGGAAQASETGEEQGMGAGQAWGAVRMGALTGAMFGPWGAVIGGVIGAGVSLMDKGVREAIGASIGKFGNDVKKTFGDVGKTIEDYAKGGLKNIQGAFNWIREGFSSIDWKGILIRALVPGGDFTIKGLEKLGEFASKLNVFDAIKNGIDTLASPVKNLWDKISNWKMPSLIPGGGNFEGLNYYGPSMAKEMQMSGGRPLIANDREFVIPRDGFPILADAVEKRISSKGRENGDVNMSPTFNITINATGLAGNDIAAAIQPAVIKILDDGMKQASGNMITRGATVI